MRIVPASEVPFEHIQRVFGTSGTAFGCQCQRYKLARGEAFRRFPVSERARRLDEQRGGLIAYRDDEPVGWCAVEPRPHYIGMCRVMRVPWEGRDEDKADASVWAVTCLLTRRGFRRDGISYALAAAAVDHARASGARALEAYPINTKDVITEELHVGTVGAFAAAGLTEVHRPSKRRVVMRIDF